MSDFVLRPAAVADLRAAYHWYQSERPGLGEEFLQAVRTAVERAAAAPLTYAIVHRDTRRVLVRRFPYGIFFRVVNESILSLPAITFIESRLRGNGEGDGQPGLAAPGPRWRSEPGR